SERGECERDGEAADDEPAGEVEQRDNDKRTQFLVEAGKEMLDRKLAAPILLAAAEDDSAGEHRMEKGHGHLPENWNQRKDHHQRDVNDRDDDPDRRRGGEKPPGASPPVPAASGGYRPAFPRRRRRRSSGGSRQ